MSVARLREWVRAAKPGARIEYARGPTVLMGTSYAMRDAVQELGAGGEGKPGLGLVTANFARDPVTREGIYLVTRTGKPLPRGVKL